VAALSSTATATVTAVGAQLGGTTAVNVTLSSELVDEMTSVTPPGSRLGTSAASRVVAAAARFVVPGAFYV
jgi:hypothetical protein